MGGWGDGGGRELVEERKVRYKNNKNKIICGICVHVLVNNPVHVECVFSLQIVIEKYHPRCAFHFILFSYFTTFYRFLLGGFLCAHALNQLNFDQNHPFAVGLNLPKTIAENSKL